MTSSAGYSPIAGDAPILLARPIEFAPGVRYRFKKINTTHYVQLYNILFSFTIAMLVFFALIWIITMILPWAMTSDFYTRTRVNNLDYTAYFFWVGCLAQSLLFIICLFVGSPRGEFARSNYSYSQIKDTEKAVKRNRVIVIIYLVYGFLMICGVITVNLLLFLTSVDADGPPFTGTEAGFDYSYDRMAVILSLFVGLLELIMLGVYAFALAQPLRKAFKYVGKSKYFVRMDVNGENRDGVILFSHEEDVKKFDNPNLSQPLRTSSIIGSRKAHGNGSYKMLSQSKAAATNFSSNNNTDLTKRNNLSALTGSKLKSVATSAATGGGVRWDV